MNSLMTLSYESKEVRTVQNAGEIWFVANDVCEILGISDAKSSVREFDSDEKGVQTLHTLGGEQEMLVVSEAGLYRLIFRSYKPEARAFQKWVMKEVLPSIRKTGSYGTLPALPPEDMEHVLRLDCQRWSSEIDLWWRQRIVKKSELELFVRGARTGGISVAATSKMLRLTGEAAKHLLDEVQKLEQADRRLQQFTTRRIMAERRIEE